MKHTRKLVALAVLIACAVAACGDGSGDGGGGGYGGGGGGGGGDIHTHDFTTQWGLLGFGTKPVKSINEAMKDRWEAANPTTTSWPASEFYPLTVDHPSIIDTPLNGALILGGIQIRFYISGNNMTVYAASGSSLTTTIRYDIAVIRNDGMGWFVSGTDKIVPAGEDTTSTTLVQNTPTPLSSLTSGRITSISGLNGFKVYAIVRNVASTSSSDWNSVRSHHNVIQIYPDPEGK